jgi:hypothetical protein
LGIRDLKIFLLSPSPTISTNITSTTQKKPTLYAEKQHHHDDDYDEQAIPSVAPHCGGGIPAEYCRSLDYFSEILDYFGGNFSCCCCFDNTSRDGFHQQGGTTNDAWRYYHYTTTTAARIRLGQNAPALPTPRRSRHFGARRAG